jgi:hypothetical protein
VAFKVAGAGRVGDDVADAGGGGSFVGTKVGAEKLVARGEAVGEGPGTPVNVADEGGAVSNVVGSSGVGEETAHAAVKRSKESEIIRNK